jgi:hypothetical protein
MTFAKSIIPVWVYRRHHATVRAATMPFKIAMLYPMWKECPVSFLEKKERHKSKKGTCSLV